MAHTGNKRAEKVVNGVRVVDVTPTPAGYRDILRYIIENTESNTDRRWARREMRRVKGVKKWG